MRLNRWQKTQQLMMQYKTELSNFSDEHFKCSSRCYLKGIHFSFYRKQTADLFIQLSSIYHPTMKLIELKITNFFKKTDGSGLGFQKFLIPESISITNTLRNLLVICKDQHHLVHIIDYTHINDIKQSERKTLPIYHKKTVSIHSFYNLTLVVNAEPQVIADSLVSEMPFFGRPLSTSHKISDYDTFWTFNGVGNYGTTFHKIKGYDHIFQKTLPINDSYHFLVVVYDHLILRYVDHILIYNLLSSNDQPLRIKIKNVNFFISEAEVGFPFVVIRYSCTLNSQASAFFLVDIQKGIIVDQIVTKIANLNLDRSIFTRHNNCFIGHFSHFDQIHQVCFNLKK
jgi:hypothetical protein